MVVTEDQKETDRYWNAIVGNGGAENACGWCNDRWGFFWQITPRRLLDLTTDADRSKAKRAFEAMMTMTKIDIATLDDAAAGWFRPRGGAARSDERRVGKECVGQCRSRGAPES